MMKRVELIFAALPVLTLLVLLAQAGPAQDHWQWCQRTFSGPNVSNPSGRYAPAMAYDAQRRVTVLFGGNYYHYRSYYYNDTWERDEAYWVRRSPTAPVPPARYASAMAYDSSRRKTVLFGGHTGQNLLSDTWEWDGIKWTALKPATAPSGRYHHAMVYDSKRKVVVLFGGWDGKKSLSDTWEWNGKTWTQRKITGPNNGIGRRAMAMAYDSTHGFTVLFGGLGPNNTVYGDVWVYDGTKWTSKFLASGPSARDNCAMAYDSGQKRTVLFGGHDASRSFSDTFAWDGSSTSWVKLSTEPAPAKNPSARYGFAMVYDSSQLGRVVLFGGSDGGYRNDTWELSRITKPGTEFAGTGHAGGGLGLECTDPQGRSTPPRLGTPFWASLINGRNSIAGSGFNLLVIGSASFSPPATLSPPAVAATASLYPLPQIVFQFQGNPAHFKVLSIPNNPTLLGLHFWMQGGSYEIRGAYRVTDALKLTIVR